jgi:hypothetical protein
MRARYPAAQPPKTAGIRLGALPGRKATKRGKLTQHGHLTKIVTASMASARAFSHDQDPLSTHPDLVGDLLLREGGRKLSLPDIGPSPVASLVAWLFGEWRIPYC